MVNLKESYLTNPKLYEEKAELLKAISHPVRLCIVKGLIESGENNVTNMCDCLSLPQSTISQHIGKLKASGIIVGTRHGLEINYKVANEAIIKIVNDLF